VFSVSREDLKIAAQYKLLDLSRIHYVGPRGGCGIDTRRFFPLLDAARKQRLRHELGLPETGKSFLVAIVARTVWEKGFREVIDVAASYPRSEVTFVVAGDGRDLGAIKASAVRRRAARSMLFLGATERVPELLRAVDAFALPSYREGVPVSLLEAMASGLPVIATNIRGAREVLEPGKTGILVDRGSAAELLRAVQTLASDAELRRQLGAAARKSVEKHYAEDVILPAYVRLWGKLIAECA
jgi:glycosyltransferase involved in cell wall biosynthesis